jgi:hypothetical protein
MSVFQGPGRGGAGTPSSGGPDAVEGINLDMEEMSQTERMNYLTARLGSADMAAAYLRSSVGADPAVEGEAVSGIDQTSKVVGCQEFNDSTPLSTRISKHYSLAMLSSNTAYSRYPIVPHSGLSKAAIMCNLKHLAVNSLDMIRDWHPAAKVGSGFRSNSSTDHGKGSAADLYFYNKGSTQRMNVKGLVEVARYLIHDLKVPFTQMLVESSGNGTGWIHIANRRAGNNSAMRVGYSLNNGGSFHPGLPKL